MRFRRAYSLIRPCILLGALALGGAAIAVSPTTAPSSGTGSPSEEGLVQCANLTYARTKSSVCFSDRFLRQLADVTSIRTAGRFRAVRLDSDELYRYPFAVMTGEGQFTLTDPERKNLKRYLERGGFLLASAGCSSSDWDRCFRDEMKRLFPDRKLKTLELTHPVFHTVFEVRRLEVKRGSQPRIEGMEIDGKLALVYSALGLNDTANAGKGCCCCGGSEILNAPAVNANILAYALTH